MELAKSNNCESENQVANQEWVSERSSEDPFVVTIDYRSR